MMMGDAQAISRQDFEIKSFIPGRLRVKARERALPIVRERSDSLLADGLARSVSINDRTRSVLVLYDEEALSKDHFLKRLLQRWGVDEADRALLTAALGEEPRSAIEPSDPAAPQAWRIKCDTPGRIRVFHPHIRDYPDIASKIDACLLNLGGVESYSVNPSTATVLVKYDRAFLPRDELLEILRSTVRHAVEEAGPEGLVPAPVPLDKTLLRLLLSSSTLALATAAFFSPVAGAVALAGAVIASSHILVSAAKAVFVERKVRVDILDATVIGLALGYRRVFPGALMIWVVDVSNVLLDASSKASRRRLAEIFGRQVRKAVRLVDGEEIPWNVIDLKVGDIVVVRSGEQIPVDGVVASGGALIDQSALTGEYAPADKTVDDRVFAMSVVLAGKIAVRVSETGADTNASKMVRLIEQATEYKVRIQSLTEYFADSMVLPTLGLGGVGYAVAGPNAMMAIINADFGTGIRIAGPLAMLGSLSLAVKNGILIKKGSVLESFNKVNAVVFDKTGTLTEEVPVVSRVISLDPAFSEEAVISYVAAAEQRFTHPIARAILREAERLGLKLPEVEESHYQMGFGIDVQIHGEPFKVGSRRYMEREGIAISPPAAERVEAIYRSGGAPLFAAANDRLVGLVELDAQPRAEAQKVVRDLREKRGIEEIYLISGDHQAPTRALAERLGIDRYFAEVLPQDKAKYVEQLQKRGLKVAMIGDGINDTVGLSQADCSVSLRGAADAATDIADIVFMDGNLSRLEILFDISDNLAKNVRRSFMLVLAPNSILITGALLGVFGLGSSLVLNNVFNLVSAINGLRVQEALLKRRGDEIRA